MGPCVMELWSDPRGEQEASLQVCGTESRLESLATPEPRSSHPSSSIPETAWASAWAGRTPASLMYSTPPEAALHTRSGSNTNSGLNKRSDHSQLANRKACGWTREGEHRGDESQLSDGRALCHSQTGRNRRRVDR